MSRVVKDECCDDSIGAPGRGFIMLVVFGCERVVGE